MQGENSWLVHWLFALHFIRHTFSDLKPSEQTTAQNDPEQTIFSAFSGNTSFLSHFCQRLSILESFSMRKLIDRAIVDLTNQSSEFGKQLQSDEGQSYAFSTKRR